MEKINSKKSSKAGKVNRINQEAEKLLDRGEALGQVIIELLSYVGVNPLGMYVATIGMAEAMAALKCVAYETHVEIEDLYKKLLANYEEEFAEMEGEQEREN